MIEESIITLIVHSQHLLLFYPGDDMKIELYKLKTGSYGAGNFDNSQQVQPKWDENAG